MHLKRCATKALQSHIKVVLVKEGDTYVTHIYRSRECYKLDELVCYRKRVFKTLEVTASESTVKIEKVEDS